MTMTDRPNTFPLFLQTGGLLLVRAKFLSTRQKIFLSGKKKSFSYFFDVLVPMLEIIHFIPGKVVLRLYCGVCATMLPPPFRKSRSALLRTTVTWLCSVLQMVCCG